MEGRCSELAVDVADILRHYWYAITGQGYLEGLALIDRIGNIDWSDEYSGQIVERFLLYAVSVVCRRSKLYE